MREIEAAHMAQLDSFELLPEAFTRVQLRGIPAGNRRFVALAGAPSWLLRAPADHLAQAANMAWVVRDAECQVNDGGDTAAGPDLSPEAIGFGPALQQLWQTSQLLGRQAAGSGRVRTMPQGFWSLAAGARHPLAERSLADAQGGSDLALGPALL